MYEYPVNSRPASEEVQIIQMGAIVGTMVGAAAGAFGTASVIVPSFELGFSKFLVGLFVGAITGALLGAVSFSISMVFDKLLRKSRFIDDLTESNDGISLAFCLSTMYLGALVSGNLLAIIFDQLSVFWHFVPPSFHESVPTLSFVNIFITVAIAWHVIFLAMAVCMVVVGSISIAYHRLANGDGRLSMAIASLASVIAIGAFFLTR